MRTPRVGWRASNFACSRPGRADPRTDDDQPASERCARLLVERGVEPVEGGYRWCSDPRLMLPAAIRLSEGQIDNLLQAIACPTQVIYATPAQSYYPEPMRPIACGTCDGRLAVFPGNHHLHMEDPGRSPR
jgi:hypothetical protein